jgi:hypothetical protein
MEKIYCVIASKPTAPAPFILEETVIANERTLRVKQSPGYLEIASGRESTGLHNDSAVLSSWNVKNPDKPAKRRW